KNVAVKDPCFFLVDMQRKFISQRQRAQLKISEFPEHLIMVAGQVGYWYALGDEFQDFTHHFHVRFGPIPFAELPDIDDVTIKDELFRSDALQVSEQLFGMASVGAEVYVGDDNQIYIPFHRQWLLIFFPIVETHIKIPDKYIQSCA